MRHRWRELALELNLNLPDLIVAPSSVFVLYLDLHVTSLSSVPGVCEVNGFNLSPTGFCLSLFCLACSLTDDRVVFILVLLFKAGTLEWFAAFNYFSETGITYFQTRGLSSHIIAMYVHKGHWTSGTQWQQDPSYSVTLQYCTRVDAWIFPDQNPNGTSWCALFIDFRVHSMLAKLIQCPDAA